MLCPPKSFRAVLKIVQVATGTTQKTPVTAARKGAGALSIRFNTCEFPSLHFVYFLISVFASSEEKAKKELNLVQREVFLAGVRVLR